MNPLKSYIKFIVNPHIIEKIKADVNLFHLNRCCDLEKIHLTHECTPRFSSLFPFAYKVNLMFLEQITGQSLSKNWSSKNINEFNLKPQLNTGEGTTLRRNNMYNFLYKWIVFNQELVRYTDGLLGLLEKPILFKKGLTIGLRSLECFEPVFTTFERWAFLADHVRRGCHIHIVTANDHTSLNEVFLGHLGIKFHNTYFSEYLEFLKSFKHK